MSDDARAIPLSEDELRHVTSYAAHCARRTIEIFDTRYPTDDRPRRAVDAAEAFARGDKRSAALRAMSWAAHAAARETEDPAAAQAAHAASLAASAAYLHPLATPHQVKHILGSAVHHALALEFSAGGDPTVGEAGIRWAESHAPDAVRDVLSRLPRARPTRTRFGQLLTGLDASLR